MEEVKFRPGGRVAMTAVPQDGAAHSPDEAAALVRCWLSNTKMTCRAFAHRALMSQHTLHQYIYGQRPISWGAALKLEVATGGELRGVDLMAWVLGHRAPTPG